MKKAFEILFVFVIVVLSFLGGYFVGKKKNIDQLTKEINRYKEINKNLSYEYEQILVEQLKERQKYEAIIKNISNSSTTAKIEYIMRSMENSPKK